MSAPNSETRPEAFFERIQGKLNPITVQYYYGPRIEKARASLPCLVQVLRAHVVMLAETAIVPRPAARALLEALAAIAEGGPAALPLDAALEDIYINLEKALAARLGAETAGYLPVARSRNDVEAAMWRIEIREDLARLAHALLRLAVLTARRAHESADTLMPGYTYGQQAQPTTAGHYFSAVAGALLRDIERLLDAIRRLDRNPLGAAAFAGTGWPIDRHRTAALLGFDGLLENTLDAVAAADYLLEALTAAAIAACSLARLAEDVFRWCANEVAFATLPDDLIDSSTIMPQKRNPVIVATIRAQARVVAGEVAGLLAASSVAYEASRDVTLAEGNVRDALAVVEGMTEITRAIVGGLQLQPARMIDALRVGFSAATELADALARDGQLPFRQAHQIVGAVVAHLSAAGMGPSGLTHAALDDVCRRIIGRALPLSVEQVQAALDFRRAVDRKSLPGGPAAAEVRRLATVQRQAADRLGERLRGMEERWLTARQALRDAEAALTSPNRNRDASGTDPFGRREP